MEPFPLRGGIVHCEDVPLPLIAREVGTPVYVYSTASMLRQARVLKAALAPLGDPLIAFAVKANPNPAVLATLAAEGLGADVVSGGEYRRARAAGIAPDRIVFSGVGKTEAEMALALDGGLCQFNLESVPEAEMLSGLAMASGRTAAVALRVNPDVDAGSHAKISTGAAHNKFGVANRRRGHRLRSDPGTAGPSARRGRGPYRQPAHPARPARGGVREAGRADPGASGGRA